MKYLPSTVESFYKGQAGDGPLPLRQWSLSTRDRLGMVLCPFYSGASLQGTGWGWSFAPSTVEPLYKGQAGDGPLPLRQWSLSTRDSLGMVLCPFDSGVFLQGTGWGWSFAPSIVESLYKGQAGDGPLPLRQWSLSTRDRLGMVLCPFDSGVSLQGTGWGWSFAPSTVEPLYKGQAGDGPLPLLQWSFSTRDRLGMVLYPFYSGVSLQGTGWGWSSIVEPLYKVQAGDGPLPLLQWSLSTRDRLEMVPSLQGTGWQWSLSTRDRW